MLGRQCLPPSPFTTWGPDTNCAPATLASALLLHARALAIVSERVGTFSDRRGIRPWTAGLSLRGIKSLCFCVFSVIVSRSHWYERTGVPVRGKMHRCRCPNIMIFPPQGNGERCLGRAVGRGEGRPHDAALSPRVPMIRDDGGAFPPVVGSDRRDFNCWGPFDATRGPCVVAFILSRSTSGGTCNGRLPTVADARSLSCCAPLDA